MKTIFVKPADVEHKWFLIDAEGKVLGRLASRVVAILRGKNKPVFTPHWDLGDSVVIPAKYSSIVLPFTEIFPAPSRRKTRAIDVLRFPVATERFLTKVFSLLLRKSRA